MFKELWDHRLNTQKQRKRLLENEAKKTEKKIKQMLDFIVEADNQSVVKAYEKRIKKLEKEKVELQEKALKCTQVRAGYRKSVRTAKTTLPFSMLGSHSSGQKEVVPRPGIEPGTQGFSVLCSTD